MVIFMSRLYFSRDIRLGAKQVVRMYGNETIITSKDGIVHRFYYDHCFWSFDSRHTDYADQEKVYKELAQPLLDRSFEGYNTCLFAYGQVSREEGEGGREGGIEILTTPYLHTDWIRKVILVS